MFVTLHRCYYNHDLILQSRTQTLPRFIFPNAITIKASLEMFKRLSGDIDKASIVLNISYISFRLCNLNFRLLYVNYLNQGFQDLSKPDTQQIFMQKLIIAQDKGIIQSYKVDISILVHPNNRIIDISSDGKYIAMEHAHQIRINKLGSTQIVNDNVWKNYDDTSIRLSEHDIYFIYDGSNSKHIINLKTRKSLERKYVYSNQIILSPDRLYMAVGGQDNSITILRIETKQETRISCHKSRIRSFCYSPTGQQLISASEDYTIIVQNILTQKPSRMFKGPIAESIINAINRQIYVTGCRDNKIRIRVLNCRKFIRKLIGHEGPIGTLAISQDQYKLVSGSYDKCMIIWDIRNGTIKTFLQQHTEPIHLVAYLQNDKYVISASYDKTMMVNRLVNNATLRK